MFRKMLKISRHPGKIIKHLSLVGWLRWVPDALYLRIIFYAYTGKKLNLKNPRTSNEKIQWLKLHDRREEMTQCSDKYEVRKYIKNIIGEEYLVPLLGVYNHVDEINFKKLPQKFVLKCTHDTSSVILCQDKSKLDIKAVKRKIAKKLQRNYYDALREWPYKNVKPRIISEQYLQDNITDYKFMCFNGEPKLILIHCNRYSTTHTLDMYDINWQKTEIKRNLPTSDKPLPKPKHFEEMVQIARILSQSDIFVRIDLYEVKGKIYFSEKTYYPASGLDPFPSDEYDQLLGRWIKLPIDN